MASRRLGNLTQASQGHTACGAPAARSRRPGSPWAQGIEAHARAQWTSRPRRGPPACPQHIACLGKARVHPGATRRQTVGPALHNAPIGLAMGDELMDILGKNLRNASGIKPAFRGGKEGRGAEARMTRRSWDG